MHLIVIKVCNSRLIGERVTELEEVLETSYDKLVFEPETEIKWVSPAKGWRKRNPFRGTFRLL